MTLEDLFIKMNEEKELKENTFSIMVTQKGTAILELYTEGIEKYWEYLTDKLLTKKIKYKPGIITIAELEEEKK